MQQFIKNFLVADIHVLHNFCAPEQRSNICRDRWGDRQPWYASSKHTVILGVMNLILTIKRPTGREISTVLLTAPYRVFFSQVIVFTRDINSASARALAGLGAVLNQLVAQPESGSEDKDVLQDALRGVDVFINDLGGDANKGLMDRLFDAALASGVAVYFPSEFGACVSFPDLHGSC